MVVPPALLVLVSPDAGAMPKVYVACRCAFGSFLSVEPTLKSANVCFFPESAKPPSLYKREKSLFFCLFHGINVILRQIFPKPYLVWGEIFYWDCFSVMSCCGLGMPRLSKSKIQVKIRMGERRKPGVRQQWVMIMPHMISRYSKLVYAKI